MLSDRGNALVDSGFDVEVLRDWGGARPGAGRPRTESLDAEELTFLAWLVNDSAYAAEYADLVDKILRIADRVKEKGR